MSRSIASPQEQSVTFVELFFDLVFVFSVTQVVGLFHHGLTLITVGQAVLVFWLVWWAWTQYTWALNAADTTYPLVQLGVLVASAVAFFMAVALPGAFQERSMWFAAAYVLVRVIGLTLYIWVAWSDPAQRVAVRTFSAASVAGLVAVLIGATVGGSAQYWIWGVAILLDVFAAAVGGQLEGWNLHTGHFAERHGLFVIIALGETLIVAAAGATVSFEVNEIVPIAILAVSITCALWWSYFPRAKPLLDHALAAHSDMARTKLARDVFSLLHFPMMCGIIAFAVSIEHVVAHPAEALSLAGRIALAVGLVLFVGGMAVAVWRATHTVLLVRVLVIAITAVAVSGVAGVESTVTLGIAFIGMLAILLYEQRAVRPIDETPHQTDSGALALSDE